MKKFFTLLTMVVMLAFSSQAAYYIVGNDPFGNWDPSNGVEMTQNADGTYSYTATINGSVWFVFADGLSATSSDWDTFNNTYRYGPTTGADQTVTVDTWTTTQKQGNGSGAYKFVGSGSDYVFTFNPFINKFKIEGAVEVQPISEFTVAGTPASVFGTEWDKDNTDNNMTAKGNGMYELDKNDCELYAGTQLQFKVVGNHDWGNAWPDENFTFDIEESGIYNLRFTFDSLTYFCGVQVSFVRPIDDIDPRTGDLFILGEVNGNGWDPSNGLKMETEDQNIFTATITTEGLNIDEADGIGYSYFSFTTKLGENSEDWNSITLYRTGAIEDGYLVSEDMLGVEMNLAAFGNGNSFKIPAGTYNVTVNLDAMTVVITAEGGEESPYTIEKLWSIDDLSSLYLTGTRQGFGMNGKFYINDTQWNGEGEPTIYVFDETGLVNTLPGSPNTPITRDEAGNLIVTTNVVFPSTDWAASAAGIKVINPETGEAKEYAIPEECGILGRCDFFGFAKGNLMEDGVLYLTGGTNSGISILTIAGGEVSADECYAAPCDGLSPTTSTVINFYKDLAGEEALLYVTRNAAPVKITFDGDDLVPAAISVPGKGACNGMFPFIWDGKEFFVYPTLPNYLNGFAVGEAGAEAPIVEVPATAAANANGYQADWLNAEIDEFGVVTIYQYYPGGNMTVYRLTSANIPEPEQTEPPVITYEVTDDGVIITVTGEGEIHVYVDGEEVDNPYVIPRGDEDVTVVVTATAKGDGKLTSETATTEIVVPAKPSEQEGDYVIDLLWENTDLSSLYLTGVRQGFGMNGKFYINDTQWNGEGEPTIYVFDENGLVNTLPGSPNTPITRDEAGNLIVTTNVVFPSTDWAAAAAGIKVINPETGETKEYAIPEECGILGRCDFFGFAKGNLMEDGVLYLTGGTNSGISILTIAGGEVSADECYAAPCDGLSPTTSTVINFYKDLAGEEALLYVTRNAAPVKITFDGDDLVPAAISVPGKGACNGMFPFIWDSKEFFVYPTLPNYLDGFAVGEAGAEAPIVEVPATAAANANGYQADWLNAEVGEKDVIIYQYYPTARMAVYRLHKKGDDSVNELNNDVEKVAASVRYYNIMGQEMQEANGLTIIVTTYTDGSKSAVKVLK